MLQFGWETGLQLILNVVVLSVLLPVDCHSAIGCSYAR